MFLGAQFLFLFLIFELFLLYFMCMNVLPACLSVHPCLLGAQGSQKRVLDFLGLELQMVVKHQVCAGN